MCYNQSVLILFYINKILVSKIHIQQLYYQGANTFAEVHSIGSYKWINIKDTNVFSLQNWKDKIHFCPYKPAKGKWILTCKTELDKVCDFKILY